MDRQFKEVLNLFCMATDMMVNSNKSAIYFLEIEGRLKRTSSYYSVIFLPSMLLS